MHAGGADGEGHVEPVVHEDGHLDGRHQGAARRRQFAGRCPLEPELDRRGPAGHRLPYGSHEVPAGEEVVVGHEQEPEHGR
jgi:hypothetical protein